MIDKLVNNSYLYQNATKILAVLFFSEVIKV